MSLSHDQFLAEQYKKLKYICTICENNSNNVSKLKDFESLSKLNELNTLSELQEFLSNWHIQLQDFLSELKEFLGESNELLSESKRLLREMKEFIGESNEFLNKFLSELQNFEPLVHYKVTIGYNPLENLFWEAVTEYNATMKNLMNGLKTMIDASSAFQENTYDTHSTTCSAL